MPVTKKMLRESSKRYDKAKEKHDSVGNFMGGIGNLNDAPVKAEFDTWSWYYTELSNLRVECSRLGLLVRINDNESSLYLKAYHAHIYSYLQLVLTILPYNIADKIRLKWKALSNEIESYFEDRKVFGKSLPLDNELIEKVDLLYDIALRIGQEIGLGFKASLSDNLTQNIERSLLGE